MVNTQCKLFFFSFICFFLSPLHMVHFWYPCIGGRNPIRLSTKVSDLQSYSPAVGPLNSLHPSYQVGFARATSFFFLPFVHILQLSSFVTSSETAFLDHPP